MAIQLQHIKYDVIYEALAGQSECGDQYLVKQLNDSILIAVADGLGHGTEAAFAAEKAMKILDSYSNEPIKALIQMCDKELQETRGIALTIARVSNNKLTYLAIGNVLGVYWQQDAEANWSKQSLFMQNGIVGSQLPSFELNHIALKPGDIFILATDGIKEKFETEPARLESPETIAKSLFKAYRNPKDDGLILVAQFL